MAASISRASKSAKVYLTPALREKLHFWRFMDEWGSFILFIHEKNVVLSITLEASCRNPPSLGVANPVELTFTLIVKMPFMWGPARERARGNGGKW